MEKRKVKRVFAFLLSLLLAFQLVAAPQRARAVAIEVTVIAGVAAILSSIGVTYWARTQSDASEYLARKLQDYFNTLEPAPVSYEDWLEIYSPEAFFSSLGGGIIRFGSSVSNKVLAFVRWLQADERIEAGGEPVGVLGERGAYIYNASSGNYITQSQSLRVEGGKMYVALSAINSSSSSYYGARWEISVPMTDSGNINLIVDSLSSNFLIYPLGWTNSSLQIAVGTIYNVVYTVGHRLVICLYKSFAPNQSWDGSITLSVQGEADLEGTPPEVVITPSDYVSVPDNLADGKDMIVTTNAPTTATQTATEAAQTITDTIASSDGLTGEQDIDEGAPVGWGFLQRILERIRGLISSIEQAVAPTEYGDIQQYGLDLTSVFPFCIPWDIVRCLSYFSAEPLTPVVSWDLPLPEMMGGGVVPLRIDLSQWDSVAEVLRHLELMLFAVGLMVETRKLIKW